MDTFIELDLVETCGDEVESNCDVMSSRLVESSFQYLLNLKLIEEVQTSGAQKSLQFEYYKI